MELLNYLLENWMPISVAIGGVIAYFLDGKKRKAELIAIQVQNKSNEVSMKTTLESSSQEIFKSLLATVSEQIDEMRENLAEIRDENLKQKDIISAMKTQILDLETQLIESNRERAELLNEQSKYKKQSAADSIRITEQQTEINELRAKIETLERKNKK